MRHFNTIKLTIVTINYNNASGLRKTMESVLAQTSRDFEYIVVDGTPQPPKGGVSEDKEVLEGFIKDKFTTENGFTRCTWLYPGEGVGGGFFSEPDSGIYNAMNKGIRMAKGEYVQFLNSGDILAAADVTERMLDNMPDCGVISGDMQLVKDGKLVKWKAPRTEEISFMTLYKGSINHSTSYIKRNLFDKYGYYDETLKIVSDWKFFLIAVGLHSEKVVLKNMTVTKFDLSGISSVNLVLREKERRLVLEELVPHNILSDYDKLAVHYDKINRINQNKLLSLFFDFVFRVLAKLDRLKYSLK